MRRIRLKASEEWDCPEEGVSFVFSRGGAGACAFGKTTYSLSPDDLVVLGGGCHAKLGATDGGELTLWYFLVQPEHLFPLFDCGEMSRLHDLMECFKNGRLYPASSALAHECRDWLGALTSQRGLQHRAELLRIAAGVLAAELSKARAPRVGFIGIEEHLAQVLEGLSVEEILNSSVSELASKFSCSKRHLNRLFHRHFGFPVATLKMEMRLLKAVSLLRDPGIKVIDVAEQCGFNHLGLFNVCFKRRFGVSPGQWRKANQRSEIHPASLAPLDPSCKMLSLGLCPWSCQPVMGKIAQGNAARESRHVGSSKGSGSAARHRNLALPSTEPEILSSAGVQACS